MESAKIVICNYPDNPIDFEKIYIKIKSYGSAAQITENSWIVSTSHPCWEIKDELSELTGTTSRIFVAELDGTFAYNNTISDELIIDSVLLTQF